MRMKGKQGKKGKKEKRAFSVVRSTRTVQNDRSLPSLFIFGHSSPFKG
jgi:hypothetical protein